MLLKPLILYFFLVFYYYIQGIVPNLLGIDGIKEPLLVVS